MARTLGWFKRRIGKRIFRDANRCKCGVCERVEKEGLIITDDQHAHYLQAIEHDFGAEGLHLNYRDKK